MIRNTLRNVREMMSWAREGREHDIPWCCALRFGYDCSFHGPWYRNKKILRILMRARSLSPRYTFATNDNQGYVPCEYHLAKWVLTGKRPKILQD